MLIIGAEVGKILEAVGLFGWKNAEVQNVGGRPGQNCPRDDGLGVHGHTQSRQGQG